MSEPAHHPYRALPARNFWRTAVAARPWHEVFAGERGKFAIAPGDKVVTAGSCFAQRIARHLASRGFNHAVYEPPHPLLDTETARRLGYGQYSARYGNLYTPRQLRQLADEALGRRPPIIDIARTAAGQYLDLMRPGIHDGGFSAAEEAAADRLYHLDRVRAMLLGADLFIFTLGLTEAWQRADGSVVYGVHPAVASGLPATADIVPVNFDYLECYNDLVYTINLVKEHNPALRFIFTVSPVALAATHQDRHVLSATSYSKSVLRAVAGKLAELCPFADYFMSYEIFSSAQSHGQFLAEDLREVNGRGVDVTMRLFETMFLASDAAPVETPAAAAPEPAAAPAPAPAAEVECEEILNAAFR